MTNLLTLKIQDDLFLELLSLNHADELFDLVNKNRTYLREFLPWLDDNKTVIDTKIFIEYSLKDYKKSGSLHLAVIFKNNLIGIVGLTNIDKPNFNATIGYWLNKEHTKKGIMTKSVKTLISYAFEKIGLNKLEIRCATTNKASNKISEKLGFKKDGILRENEYLYDHFVDHNVYSLLKSDLIKQFKMKRTK